MSQTLQVIIDRIKVTSQFNEELMENYIEDSGERYFLKVDV